MKNISKNSVSIIPSVFIKPGVEGDFKWMIKQDKYKDSFFIFNDNEEQFLEFQNNKDKSKGIGCYEGDGNAVIRPWQCKSPPRAGGIPTGLTIGYKSLDQKTAIINKTVRDLIDQAILHIKKTVAMNNYKRVYFSSESKDGKTLGTGTFKVGNKVKEYIIIKINTMFD